MLYLVILMLVVVRKWLARITSLLHHSDLFVMTSPVEPFHARGWPNRLSKFGRRDADLVWARVFPLPGIFYNG